MIKYLFFFVGLTGCSTVYENGKPVFQTSSNIVGLHYRSPAGTTLDASSIDNSTIHQAIGTEVVKGITATGAAVYTGGNIFLK